MKWEPDRRVIKRLRLAVAPMAFAILGTGTLFAGTPDSYSGPSGGNWSVGTNWSAGEPNSSSDVTVSGNIAVYFDVTGSTTINSLAISSGAVLNLDAGCNLTATSNAAMSGSYLNASSAFSAPTTTAANGMQLSASSGGSIALAALASFDSVGANPSLQASGANSLVSLPALTSATMTSNLYFQASSGGDVEAPKLSSLSFPNAGEVLALYSTGSGSMVDVAALGGTSLQNLYVQVHTGGTVNWGSPTSVQNSTLLLDTAGTLNTGSLANIDGTQLTSTNGATFNLPVTSYNAGSANPQWQASNANSKLTLPNLTSVTTNSNFGLTAQNGGDIEVPKLSTITYISGGTASIDFNLQAIGANSIINASGLSPSLTDLYVVVRTGGTVNWGSPTSVTNSTLTMDTGGTLNTSALSHIDGTSLTATSGATFSFPAVTSFNAGNNAPQWQSTNANSTLTVSLLNALTSNSNFGLSAQNGGTINLPALTSMSFGTNGDLYVQSGGANSVANLSGLLSTGSATTTSALLSNGGQILLGAPGKVANVSFSARFNNANGSLGLYENGTLLESITPNNVNTFETYNFSNLPAASDVELLASGSNSSVTIESYQIAAVPEPSLECGAMLVLGMGLLRRPVWRRRGKYTR